MSSPPRGLFDAIKQAPNLTTGLVESLIAQIEKGGLLPGQRLPTEQAIVAATGVSRTVVREALASLRARGLITTRQGLGAFVAEAPQKSFSIAAEDMKSVSEVLNVLELRIGVEAEAAGLAAERRTAADIRRMESHLTALDASIEAQGSGVEEDFAFHRAILVSTGNSYFARVFDVFGGMIIPRQRVRLGAMPAEERKRYLRQIQREHRAILAAIKGCDASGARRTLRHHLTKAYARYQSLTHPTGEPPSKARGRG